MMSSLTSGMTAATSAGTPKQSQYKTALSDDDEPSPKKALPDFNACKCNSDSVASSDNSAGWDAEEERVMDALAAQMVAKDAIDAHR